MLYAFSDFYIVIVLSWYTVMLISQIASELR